MMPISKTNTDAVLEILHRHIRLVCKERTCTDENCECTWMVKPGTLEASAAEIVKMFQET